MKFMLIMRSSAATKEAYENADSAEIISAMGAYNGSLLKAGVLLAGEGLADDLEDAFVIDFSEETPIVTDGPYGEVHELFNGFCILQVSSKEEAVQWASRAPLGAGSKLEVRRVTEMADFAEFADNEYLKKEETWREEVGQP